MSRSKYLFVFCFVCVFSSASLVSGRSPQDQPADITERDAAAAAKLESRLIRNTRQLTFEGKRAGEGYFSADGKQIVFQSERDPANPFYQIYLMDLENGDQEKISPGQGKTTCAWIHPEGDRVLFSSTHADPEALEKQKYFPGFYNENARDSAIL